MWFLSGVKGETPLIIRLVKTLKVSITGYTRTIIAKTGLHVPRLSIGRFDALIAK